MRPCWVCRHASDVVCASYATNVNTISLYAKICGIGGRPLSAHLVGHCKRDSADYSDNVPSNSSKGNIHEQVSFFAAALALATRLAAATSPRRRLRADNAPPAVEATGRLPAAKAPARHGSRRTRLRPMQQAADAAKDATRPSDAATGLDAPRDAKRCRQGRRRNNARSTT